MKAPTLAELQRHAADGARAWWDGYTIAGHNLKPGQWQHSAFVKGWKAARDEAIRQGQAAPCADNTLPGSPGTR